jgi:hypothetical protein
MYIGTPLPKSALSYTKSLEARIEALEFLVLGLLRGNRESGACKMSVVSTFLLMDELLALPELKKQPAYQLECKMHYADAVVLTWCDEDSSPGWNEVHH